MPRVLVFAEGKTRPSVIGLDGKVRRSHQAVGMQKEICQRTREAPEAPGGWRREVNELNDIRIRSSRVRRGVL